MLAEASPTVIAVHGEESEEEVLFLGGLDEERQKKFRDSLIASGFTVKQHHNPLLQGAHDANICNQGASGRGVQMELSKGLRTSFFESLTAKGRQTTTPQFEKFVAAIRRGLAIPD